MFKSRKQSPSKAPVKHRGLLRRLRDDRSGTTALEFAIIATPFFALMLAIIEVSLVFFANFSLENAVERAGRMIRTGQVQQQGFSEAQFKQSICDNSAAILDCMSGLKLDVITFDDFSSVNVPSPLDADGELKTNFGFNPGSAGNVVIVRAFYEWDLIAQLPGGLGNMPGGGRLLMATSTFRNEPFDN